MSPQHPSLLLTQVWGSTGQRGHILLGESLVREAGGWGIASGPVQGWHRRKPWASSSCRVKWQLTVVPADPPSSPLLPEEEDRALPGQASGLSGLVPGCKVIPARWAENRHLPELLSLPGRWPHQQQALPWREEGVSSQDQCWAV